MSFHALESVQQLLLTHAEVSFEPRPHVEADGPVRV